MPERKTWPPGHGPSTRHRAVRGSRLDDRPSRPDPRLSDVDEWGRSEHMRAHRPPEFYDPLYSTGSGSSGKASRRSPTEGGALLVANHAGAIPSDAPSIMHGIEEELGRPVYGMADFFFREAPWSGTMWARVGGVPAHPDNAYRLLHDQGQLALVFPEGTKGPSKSYADRYRLRRFGRGGFVEIAMRAGVPVIPIAVVGAEESMPDRLPPARRWPRRWACPTSPSPPTCSRFGPLGPGHALPGQVQAAGPRPGHLQRAARPGALLEEPGHGGGREDPHQPAGDPLRDAARAAQRLVRLRPPWGAAS